MQIFARFSSIRVCVTLAWFSEYIYSQNHRVNRSAIQKRSLNSNRIYKTHCRRVSDGSVHLLQFNMNEMNTGCRQSFHQPTHNDFNSFRLVFCEERICHTNFGFEIQIFFSHYSVNCFIK